MMSGENFLNLLIITSEDEYKEFFLNLLNSTDLKWSTSIFCKTQHEAEVEFLKTEPNFIVIFLNKIFSN